MVVLVFKFLAFEHLFFFHFFFLLFQLFQELIVLIHS